MTITATIPARVLVTKIGLDGHDRGSRIIAAFLRDAGMEVIYLGQFQTPEKVAQAAAQEDVDVVGLSCYVGQHLNHASKVRKALQENGMKDTLLIIGGVIPKVDVPKLKEMGVDRVFRVGSSVKDIVAYIRENVKEK